MSLCLALDNYKTKFEIDIGLLKTSLSNDNSTAVFNEASSNLETDNTALKIALQKKKTRKIIPTRQDSTMYPSCNRQ